MFKPFLLLVLLFFVSFRYVIVVNLIEHNWLILSFVNVTVAYKMNMDATYASMIVVVWSHDFEKSLGNNHWTQVLGMLFFAFTTHGLTHHAPEYASEYLG